MTIDRDEPPAADDVPSTDVMEMLTLAGDGREPAPSTDTPRTDVPHLVHLGDGILARLPKGLNRFVAALLSWLLLPVYVTVGPFVRARTVRMAPAAGPNAAVIPGAGKPIRLLVIGDSSVASVGVSRTRQGLASRIAEELAHRTGRPVNHVSYGNNSATAADLRDHVVPNLPRDGFTHVVVVVGANDAKNFHSAGAWRESFGTLLYMLRSRYPGAKIVWSRLFEFSKLPAIPRPLGWFLDLRRVVVCRIADELCLERGAHAAPFMNITDADGLSLDGFHPSVMGYRMWGAHLAEFITSIEASPRPVRQHVPSVARAEAVRSATLDEGLATAE